MKCLLCDDCGWVCETHPDQPWTGPHACTCGGAGAPCPRCNVATADEPRLPNGFEPDVMLDDGTKLKALRDAIHYLAKTVPRAERDHEMVLTASDHLTRSAEQGYPLFARAATLRAIHRNKERVFNPDRKEHHWGKRKLKRDQ